jgi:hypothetical protein
MVVWTVSDTVLDDLIVEPAEMPQDDSPVVVPQLEGIPDPTIDPNVEKDQPESLLSPAERVRQAIKGSTGARGKRGDLSGGATQSKPRSSVPPKPRAGTLVKPLTRLYTSLGMMLLPFDPQCAKAVIDNAENCARSLEALAQENEAVRRAILAITSTSAWGGLVIAHLPILLMVTVHHAPKEIAESVAPMAQLINSDAFREADVEGFPVAEDESAA